VTGQAGEYGVRGWRVEGTIIQEPERSLVENRKWTRSSHVTFRS
jgi:hypothetical protein